MGIFSNSSPFDQDIEKATSEKNTAEEWGLIMDICDKVGSSSTNAKDCLRSIIKRLANPDPHIVVQAITLLDACVNNCGKNFHLEIASRDFETEYCKLLAKAQPPVAQKLKGLLKKWAEAEFKSDPQLNLIPSLVSKLRSEGIDFNDASDMPTKKKEPSRSSTPASNPAQKEEEDLARAIELSLQENKHSSPRNSGGTSTSTKQSLYPSMNPVAAAAPVATQPEARKVRALYDFEAAEDNELTFLSGEIIHVIDSSDPNWWKGYNQRGEGLFPANFVTSDLSEPATTPRTENRKNVQFSDSVQVKNIEEAIDDSQPVEIDEGKIDRLILLLHEANPEDGSNDTQEMLQLENEVNRMGPLIDQALEKADRRHAQLTQLSSDLVDALNLYHTLMRETQQPQHPTGIVKGPFPQAGPHFPQQAMYNGTTPYASMPQYFPHVQHQGPGSMVPPTSMMGMPGHMHSMPAMMMMAPSQQPPLGTVSMGMMPPGPPQSLSHAQGMTGSQSMPSTQHFQQQSYAPPGGAYQPSPAAPPGTSQSYVM